jgi:hypothetical protein
MVELPATLDTMRSRMRRAFISIVRALQCFRTSADPLSMLRPAPLPAPLSERRRTRYITTCETITHAATAHATSL